MANSYWVVASLPGVWLCEAIWTGNTGYSLRQSEGANSEGGNVLFVDGHVKWLSEGGLPPYVVGAPARGI